MENALRTDAVSIGFEKFITIGFGAGNAGSFFTGLDVIIVGAANDTKERSTKAVAPRAQGDQHGIGCVSRRFKIERIRAGRQIVKHIEPVVVRIARVDTVAGDKTDSREVQQFSGGLIHLQARDDPKRVRRNTVVLHEGVAQCIRLHLPVRIVHQTAGFRIVIVE